MDERKKVHQFEISRFENNFSVGETRNQKFLNNCGFLDSSKINLILTN